MSDAWAALARLLEHARDQGFLGPGPVEAHVDHAVAFAEAAEAAWTADRVEGRRRAGPIARAPSTSVLERAADDAGQALDLPGRVLELGAGGGVPGLVLAMRWSTTMFVLVEAGRRRVEHLQQACEDLGLAGRVEVAMSRAEELGHEPAYRGSYDAVVARSFGPPAVTAECAAPFLRIGGMLVVSEPPAWRGPGRGPEPSGGGDPLEEGGCVSSAPGSGRWPAEGLAALGMGPAAVIAGRYTFALVPQRGACPERFARRVGVPAKRPLF